MTLDFRKDADASDLLAETTEVSSSSEHSDGVPGQGLAEQMAAVSPDGGIVQQLEAVRPGAIRDPGAVQQVAAAGVQGGGSQLPHASEIQSAFGHHDIGSIDSHVGGAAGAANRAMGAEAYATGNQVAFESAPDLHTAAHEAAHVVQQRAGNSPSGGVSTPGDSLEHNADAAADAVTSGRSAEGLLDSVASPGATGGGDAVQCKEAGSSGGIHYEEVQEGGTEDMTFYEQGSAMVASSAGDTQEAYDDSYTPKLVQWLNDNPAASTEDALNYISHDQLKAGHDHFNALREHHPTVAAYGDPLANLSPEETPRQLGQIITNQNYPKAGKLNTPHAEGAALAASLSGRGFAINHNEDKTASVMNAQYTSQLIDQAKPGDELIAYFAGHGSSEGMLGIDHGYSKTTKRQTTDILPNQKIADLTRAAVDKGAHMRFILDACYSGAAANFVRQERFNELAQQDAAFQVSALGGAALRLDMFKEGLVDHCNEMKCSLKTIHRQKDAHAKAMNEPIREYWEKRDKLDKTDTAGLKALETWLNAKLKPMELEANRLQALYLDARRPYDERIDAFWDRIQGVLLTINNALKRAHRDHVDMPHYQITNYDQLSKEISYLDYLQNLALKTPPPRVTSGDV